MELATLGGGCFWCVEAVFLELRGVSQVVSGYSGGDAANPSYELICTGTSGHAEVIQITFDPQVVSYEQLLTVFFHLHDPTTLNRQGNDVGTQYRSVVFYHDDDQQRVAETVKQAINAEGVYAAPIVTEISPLTAFYPAEPYHQNYYAQNPHQPYCSLMIGPKIEKVRQKFAHLIG